VKSKPLLLQALRKEDSFLGVPARSGFQSSSQLSEMLSDQKKLSTPGIEKESNKGDE